MAGYMASSPSFRPPVSRIDMTVKVSYRAPSVEELRVLQRRIAEISGAFKTDGGEDDQKRKTTLQGGPLPDISRVKSPQLPIDARPFIVVITPFNN